MTKDMIQIFLLHQCPVLVKKNNDLHVMDSVVFFTSHKFALNVNAGPLAVPPWRLKPDSDLSEIQ